MPQSYPKDEREGITFWYNPDTKKVVVEGLPLGIAEFKNLVEVKEFAFKILDEATKLENHTVKPVDGKRKLKTIAKNYAKKVIEEWEQDLIPDNRHDPRPNSTPKTS